MTVSHFMLEVQKDVEREISVLKQQIVKKKKRVREQLILSKAKCSKICTFKAENIHTSSLQSTVFNPTMREHLIL